MYNGIGLQTARGSGTNGYVQRNLSFVQVAKNKVEYKTEDEIRRFESEYNKPPNQEILEHHRKRKIEVLCLELEEKLEKQGLTDEELAKRIDEFRKEQYKKMEKALDHRREFINEILHERSVKETHQLAELSQNRNSNLKSALGISADFVEGSSMDIIRQAKEQQAAREEKLKANKDLIQSTLKDDNPQNAIVKSDVSQKSKMPVKKEFSGSSSSSSGSSSESSGSSSDSDDSSSSSDSSGSNSSSSDSDDSRRKRKSKKHQNGNGYHKNRSDNLSERKYDDKNMRSSNYTPIGNLDPRHKSKSPHHKSRHSNNQEYSDQTKSRQLQSVVSSSHRREESHREKSRSPIVSTSRRKSPSLDFSKIPSKSSRSPVPSRERRRSRSPRRPMQSVISSHHRPDSRSPIPARAQRKSRSPIPPRAQRKSRSRSLSVSSGDRSPIPRRSSRSPRRQRRDRSPSSEHDSKSNRRPVYIDHRRGAPRNSRRSRSPSRDRKRASPPIRRRDDSRERSPRDRKPRSSSRRHSPSVSSSSSGSRSSSRSVSPKPKKTRKDRSRSRSIPRRHGSPSFLDKRRITSARKRPVPYKRTDSSSSPDSADSISGIPLRYQTYN